MNAANSDDRMELDAAVDAARQRYILNNTGSARAHDEARRVMPGGNTRSVLYNAPFPLRIIRGTASIITDADDHDYINLLGEYTAGLFGHSHPAIRQAIDQALDSGINLSAHNYHEIRLATLICERFPSVDLVRFTNSGTEANLMAIASARYTTGRNKVMVFNGGYHGGLLYFGQGGIPINAPYEYILANYNDLNGTRALLDQRGHEIACILVEPMQGSAGCIPAQPGFLSMLREQATANSIVLIFDEVMTSRLSPGGAQLRYGIIPDMTTLGKYIGGGMSFGAFGGDTEIMGIYDPENSPAIPHAGTFNNNTLSMAAGVAALGEVFTPDAADGLNATGDRLRQALNAICQEYGLPMQFCGIGSLMNLHGMTGPVTCQADLAESDDRIRELVFLGLLERGIYIARRGFIALMLTHSDDELATFKRAFTEVAIEIKAILGSLNSN